MTLEGLLDMLKSGVEVVPTLTVCVAVPVAPTESVTVRVTEKLPAEA